MAKSASEEERAHRKAVARKFQEENGGKSKRGKNWQHATSEDSPHTRKDADNRGKAKASRSGTSRRQAWRP